MEIIAAHPEVAQFVGPRRDDQIKEAEAVLGGAFPPSFGAFLRQLGAGSFGHEEFYGLVDGPVRDSGIPGGVWLTMEYRRVMGLSHDLFVVGTNGAGDDYYLRLTGPLESPVYVHWHELTEVPDPQQDEIVAEDFGRFLRDTVSDVCSVLGEKPSGP